MKLHIESMSVQLLIIKLIGSLRPLTLLPLLLPSINADECGYREAEPDCMTPPVFCAQGSHAIECNVGTRYHIHCSDMYENVDAYPQMKCVAAGNTFKRCVEMANY